MKKGICEKVLICKKSFNFNFRIRFFFLMLLTEFFLSKFDYTSYETLLKIIFFSFMNEIFTDVNKKFELYKPIVLVRCVELFTQNSKKNLFFKI